MGINWSSMITIFLAIVLAKLFTQSLLSGSHSHSHNNSTQVGAETNSPAEAVVIYANKIDEYLAKHYPGAQR